MSIQEALLIFTGIFITGIFFTYFIRKLKNKNVSNYQRIMVSWAILLFVGFDTSYFIKDLIVNILLWLILVGAGIFYQFKLTWSRRSSNIIIQIMWLILIILGSTMTLLILLEIIPITTDLGAGWLLLIGVGMILTGIFNKNFSYYMLSIIYFVSGLILEYAESKYSLLFAGLVFLVLCYIDALLEYTPVRELKS